MKRVFFLVQLSLILLYSKAYAWGALGHQIVANVAEATLTSQAKAEVAKLIPNQKLADISNWPDQVRSTPAYKYTAPWHFADIPDGESYETISHDPKGDVVQALEKQIEVLKNTQTTVQERIEALKFVVHFMGDIHQPLHVGRPDDKGGNLVKVTYKGKTINLHALWDSGFVEELVMDLDSNVAPAKEFTLLEVLNEDMALRNEIYNFSNNVIDETYAQKAREIVRSRLQLGGERLGTLLNSLFQVPVNP